MLLSELIDKRIIVSNVPRGTCIGVGISKKDGKIKYLCCTETNNKQARFFIPISCLSLIENEALHLQNRRAVFPNKCVYLRNGLNVYTTQGEFLGVLQNAHWKNDVLTALTIDNKRIPFCAVSAIGDIVLIQNTQRFPLGQPIPDHYKTENTTPIYAVTKTLLKNAIQEQSLIRLTLSLSPFNVR